MLLHEVQKKLSDFRGGSARLWHFTASHDRLAIALTAKGADVPCYLVLLGCTSVRLPTSWRLGTPALAQLNDAFVFSDSDVEVHFHYEAQIVESYG